MGMQLPVNQSLLKLPADRGRTFTFCRCITLASEPKYSLTKSVTLFKRLYYNPATRDQHSWLKMASFHMIILADKFPNIVTSTRSPTGSDTSTRGRFRGCGSKCRAVVLTSLTLCVL